MRFLRMLVGGILFLVAAPRLIAGYIDPNTGGMLFQIFVAIFALGSAIILFFSRQVREAFARVARFFRERSSR